jgi:pilus assembly protein CpaC
VTATRKLAVIFALALAAPLSISLASAKPALDEGSARVITISTRSGPTHQRLTLPLDKAAVVQLDTDARDVMVSNPDLVDAVVRTPRRIFLLATKVGQTNAFFFDAEGKQILALDIRVEKDVVDLANMIKASMPNSSIQVQAMNDNVVLTGAVSSTMESQRAADLAARFAGDPKKVINMLTIAGGTQVMLRVRVAEMDRNIAKQFGINLTSAATVGGVPIVAQSANPYGLMGSALSNLSGAQIGSTCGAALIANTTGTLTTTVTNNLSTNSQILQPGVANGVTTTGTTNTCASPNSGQGVLNALEQVGLVHMLARPRNSWPAANFPSRPAATSRATSRSSSSSSASASASPRWCCPKGASASSSPPKSANCPPPASSLCRAPPAPAVRWSFRVLPCAVPRPRSNCPRAAASPSPA